MTHDDNTLQAAIDTAFQTNGEDWQARAEKAEAELVDMRESLETKERVHRQDSEALEKRLYAAEAQASREAEVCPICKGRCGIYAPEPDIFTPCAACGGTGEKWQCDCLNSTLTKT